MYVMFAIFDYLYIQVYAKYYYRWIVFYEVETYEQKCKFVWLELDAGTTNNPHIDIESSNENFSW